MEAKLVLIFTVSCSVMYCSGLLTKVFDDEVGYFLKHFKVNLVTLVQEREDINWSNKAGFDHHKCLKKLSLLNVGISFVPFTMLGRSYARGAVFIPAPVMLHDSVTKLFLSSSERNPVFLITPNESAIPVYIRKVGYIPYSSRVYVISHHPTDENRTILQEMYHAQETSSELLVNIVGERFYDSSGLNWHFETINTLPRRSNLMGAHVRLLYPSFMFDAVDTTGLARDMWYTKKVIYTMLERANVSIHTVVSAVALEKDDLWSGLIGKLVKREADFALVLFNPVSSLVPYLDFTQAVSNSAFKLYIRKPSVSFSLSTMVKGFSTTLWVACLFNVIILTTGIFIIIHVTSMQIFEDEPTIEFSECCLVILGTHCAEGWQRTPKSLSGKILCLSSLLVGLLLNMFYVSQLQANIAVNTAPLPFTDLEGFVAKRSYNMLMLDGSIPHQEAVVATTGIMKQVFEVMHEYQNSLTISYVEGLERICSERAVVFGMSITCEYLLRKAPCPITDTRVSYYHRTLAIPVRKNYPLTELLSYNILRYTERGLFHPMFARHNVESAVVEEVVGTGFQAVDLVAVVPFLVLYAVSMCLPLGIFLVEHLRFMVQHRCFTAFRL